MGIHIVQNVEVKKVRAEFEGSIVELAFKKEAKKFHLFEADFVNADIAARKLAMKFIPSRIKTNMVIPPRFNQALEGR